MSRKRPARKPIPLRVLKICRKRQREICACGCGESIQGYAILNAHHFPALIDREIDETYKDYIPPQLDPEFIFILIEGHHRTQTFGRGGTTRIETRSGDIGTLHHNRRAQSKHQSHVAIMRAKGGGAS